jgi:hypothetical protein
MLEIAQPDDAGCAMGRTAIMPGFISLDPEDMLAAARQMIECGAPHGAEPAHDRVELSHGVESVAWARK